MARGDGASFSKKRRGAPRTPMGLGPQPRISDPIAFAVAFAIAYFLVTRGHCVPPWCNGGVIETATAITALIGSILGLIWRAIVWLVPRRRGSGGRRSKRRQTKPPALTVVSVDPPHEAPAARRDGAGDARSNSAGLEALQAAGEIDARVGRASPTLAPTMWPTPPLQPPLPLEPPAAYEATGRSRDAD